MSKRQKEWARVAREALVKQFGGACEHCGGLHNLTFDVINPTRRTMHSRKDSSARVSFYRQMAARGNLQLLCRSCNARKNDRKTPRR